MGNGDESSGDGYKYRGRGATDDTQGVGWFTRLLLKLAPF
jgi:predicted chitinase